jgi:hypothetical protein
MENIVGEILYHNVTMPFVKATIKAITILDSLLVVQIGFVCHKHTIRK